MLFYSGFVLLMSDLPLGPASPVITQWPVFRPAGQQQQKQQQKPRETVCSSRQDLTG